MLSLAALSAIDLILTEAPKLGALGARIADAIANHAETPEAQRQKAAAVRDTLAACMARNDDNVAKAEAELAAEDDGRNAP